MGRIVIKKFYVGVKGIIKQNDQVLVLKKNEGEGFWEVCGGRIDGDETIEQTLQRELAEELPGIKNVKLASLLGAHRLPKDIDGDTSLTLLYYQVEATLPEPIVLSSEHTEYRWVKSSTEVSLNGGAEAAVKLVLGQ